MMNVRATATGFSADQIKRASGEEDELGRQVWGVQPGVEAGDIVVLEGEIGAEPFRLWFVTKEPLQGGGSYRVGEDEAAQLTIGRPYSFVSNRVQLSFTLNAEGTQGFLRARGRRSEVLGGPRNRYVEGSFRLKRVSPSEEPLAELPREAQPLLDYVPERLPQENPIQAPPTGYRVHKIPDYRFIIAGSATFAFFYGVPLAIAAGTHFDGYSDSYAIPVLGPTVFLVRYLEDGNVPGLGLIGGVAIGIGTVGMTMAQAAGLALLGVGFLAPKREWVLEQPRSEVSLWRRLRFTPLASPGFQGLSVSGQF
jgi:hypothetical protein